MAARRKDKITVVVYKNLQFPTLSNRPYFYANFVITVDGKVAVKNDRSYEPIGSKNDYDTFIDLRTYADTLIHGKTTAKLHRTVETKMQKEFLDKRKKRNKNPFLPYFIVANNPDESLLPALENNPGEKPFIVTNQNAKIASQVEHLANILRFGEKQVDLASFSAYLFQQGYKTVLIEGGPTLLYSFLEQDLLDEVFLTISPKIFAGRNEVLSIVEGPLFTPETIKKLTLISTITQENEVFLRYKLLH